MADGVRWDMVDDRLNALDNCIAELNNSIGKVGEDWNARWKVFEKAIIDLKREIRTQTTEPRMEKNGEEPTKSNDVHKHGMQSECNSEPFMAEVNSFGDCMTRTSPTWCGKPESAFSAEVGSGKMLADSSVRADVGASTCICKMAAHEISKLVQHFLPRPPEHSTWTPPSRDFMNKDLTCQMCKLIIDQVDTALVCDCCEEGSHLKCLHYSSVRHPKGNWHCGTCLALKNGKLSPQYGKVCRLLRTTLEVSSPEVADTPTRGKSGNFQMTQSIS